MISEPLRKITENFEKGFSSSTLLGWTPSFDKQGRPLNANPNYRDGNAKIEGKTYWFTRKGWIVRIWDRPSRYTDFMSNEQDFIEEVDLTPDYIRDRELLQQEYVIGSGYMCSINGNKVFVVATSIEDCMEQLKIIANGKSYQMEAQVSIPVCHCP